MATGGMRGEGEVVAAGGAAMPVRGGVLPLYAATMLASALLLFWVEPMFTRMVLPLLGGSPAVWNTAMVFFQAALLAGYAYAHVISRWLGPRRQVLVHLALLALGATSLPLAVGAAWQPPASGSPILWLIGLLTVSLGLPFLALSASAPLLQKWFATTRHEAAGDPYFLYAASNLGSIAALLGYPLLLEPLLTLERQSLLWSLGYGGLALLTVACALTTWRARAVVAPAPGAGLGSPAATIGWRRRVHWLGLALVPSALLLAVTAHITTDLAAVPLLWVVPLTLYLLTFVLVFARRPLLRHQWMVRAQPFLLIPLVLLFVGSFPFWLGLPLHLGAFFLTAMVCHGELARRRPPPRHLTEFYFWMALGGTLGGAFAALLAPVLFDGVWEYPIALAAACALRPTTAEGRRRRSLDLALPVIVACLLLAHGRWQAAVSGAWGMAGAMALLVPAALLLYGAAARPVRFALGVAAALLIAIVGTDQSEILGRERSFFGVYTVKRDPAGYRVLLHGTTVHGAESIAPATRDEPLTYYHRAGPLGQLMAALDRPPLAEVAAVGLGIGTVACYRRPGERWTFFEIDPKIEAIARDQRYFHYLEDCAPGAEVVLGDARLALARAPAGGFDLMILDAFSSDAIPVHLITREALALYLDRLSPRGVIAWHVSNRNLDLVPVVADLVADAGVQGWLQTHQPEDAEAALRGYRGVATWIVIGRAPGDVGSIAADPRWRPLEARENPRPWSDDFIDLLGALRWAS